MEKINFLHPGVVLGFDREILSVTSAMSGSRCPPIDPSSAKLSANAFENSAFGKFLASLKPAAPAYAPAYALAA